MNLADYIREEIRKDDILAPIKDKLMVAIVESIKATGVCRIMCSYMQRNKPDEFEKESYDGSWSVRIAPEKKTALIQFIEDQGLRWEHHYFLHTGEYWGIYVKL